MAQAIILSTSTPVAVTAPTFEGQKVIDTTNNKVYIAYGLTNADWQEVGSGGTDGIIYTSAIGSITDGVGASWNTSTSLGYDLTMGASGTGGLTITRDVLTAVGTTGSAKLFLRVDAQLTGSVTINSSGSGTTSTVYYTDNRGVDTAAKGTDTVSLPITNGFVHFFEIDLGGSGSTQWCVIRKISQQ